jgi:uncharacterized phiE125 gp8 family phage protein
MTPTSLTVVTAATSEPVSLAEMRVHLRVIDTAEDDLISSLITTARQYIEDQTQLAIATQTYRLTLDGFPLADISDYTRADGFYYSSAVPITLPRSPVSSVSSITYVDTAGTTQTLSSSLYRVATDSLPGRVAPAYNQTWPWTQDVIESVKVTFVAGYTTAPKTLTAAIKLLVGHLYQHREPTVTGTIVADLPFSIQSLINNHKVLA